MTGQPIDYQAVLDDLMAKRQQIDAAIEGIRAMASMSGGVIDDQGVEVSPTSPPPAGSPERSPGAASGAGLADDTFFGLSTSAAVKKFLGMVKRPQSPRAIADALQNGGQVHAVNDKVAYTNTYTALKRLQKAGEAVQIKSGDWGLAEWYSNRPKGDGE